MKHFFFSFSMLLISSFAHAQYKKILTVIRFDNLTEQVNVACGTKENPIESGAFMSLANPQSRNACFVKLFNSYRWPNGDKIDFSNRHSTRGAGSNGIVDVYTLVNPETKDTLRLHVDPYKTSKKYEVPKGLVALSAAILKPEIEPILLKIEEVNDAEDGTKLKFHIGAIMNYISSNFDRNQLLDLNRLDVVLKDGKADKDLITYLVLIYMMNKYYALAKDIDNETDYAFLKMKEGYQKFVKANPGANTGALNDSLN